jgi:TPR repeat protein
MNSLLLLITLMAASAFAADTASSPGPASATSVVAADTDTVLKSGDKAFLENDFSGAEAQYIEAMKQGSEEAVRKLFIIYTTDGNPNHISEREAIQKLAELGSTEHQITLGQNYLSGMGVERNEAEAFKWYRKAAEQRNAWGASLVAEMYDSGTGVEEDSKEAYVWARLSEEWKALPSNANWNSGAPKPEVTMSERMAEDLSSSEQRQAEAEVQKRMQEYEERNAAD